MPANSLCLAVSLWLVPFFFFLLLSSHTHTHRHTFRSSTWKRAHIHTHAHTPSKTYTLTSTEVKRWPLVGRVCLLFQYYVSLHHRHRAHHRYYHYYYYYNLDGRGLHGRVRIKERRGEKRAKKERLRNEGWSKREEKGSAFSLNSHPWLNLARLRLCRDLPRNEDPFAREGGRWRVAASGRWAGRGESKKETGAIFYEEPVGGFPTPTTVKHSSRQFSSSFLISAGKMRLAISFVFFLFFFH